MVRTYANYAYYEDFVIGMTEQDGQVDENGIVYQEFFGPDSTGKTLQENRQDTEYGSFGITYMVAESLDATEVYIVTGDVLTAWATTWGDPTSSNPRPDSAPPACR